jgi:hypothetical protein
MNVLAEPKTHGERRSSTMRKRAENIIFEGREGGGSSGRKLSRKASSDEENTEKFHFKDHSCD